MLVSIIQGRKKAVNPVKKTCSIITIHQVKRLRGGCDQDWETAGEGRCSAGITFFGAIASTHTFEERCENNVNSLTDSKNALFFKASRNALKGLCGFTVVVRQQEVLAGIVVSLFGQHCNVFMTDWHFFFSTRVGSIFCQRSRQPDPSA